MRCICAGRPRWKGRYCGWRSPRGIQTPSIGCAPGRLPLRSNMAVASSIPFVRKHMISVLASKTKSQTRCTRQRLPPSSSSATRAITRRLRHLRREAGLKVKSFGLALRRLLPPAPPAPFTFIRGTKSFMMSLLLWHAKTGEYTLDKGLVNGVVRFDNVAKICIQHNSFLPRQLL